MIPEEFRKHFQLYSGAIFGATSTEKLTRTTTIALGSLAKNCQAFEVAGVTFTRVYASESWNSDHNYCIALVPPRPHSTGEMIVGLWVGAVHAACEQILFEFHCVIAYHVRRSQQPSGASHRAFESAPIRLALA
jgi:hypothetical protein